MTQPIDAVIITTIHGPDHGAMPAWIELCEREEIALVVVGDEKTPNKVWRDATVTTRHLHWLSLDGQDRHWPELSRLIPRNCYTRKNLGYLQAFQHLGCEAIFETDDDNWPFPDFVQAIRNELDRLVEHEMDNDWQNPWEHFRLGPKTNVWPRGVPVNTLECERHQCRPVLPEEIGARHFMCRGEPDRDAVQRLVQGPARLLFTYAPPLVTDAMTYTAFNTQSTILYKRHLRQCYIPSTCSHRFTDILRGYLLKRHLHSIGECVAFHGPVVRQKRNDHDLWADFRSEAQMHAFIESGGVERLCGDYSSNLEALCIEEGVLTMYEDEIYSAWCETCDEVLT